MPRSNDLGGSYSGLGQELAQIHFCSAQCAVALLVHVSRTYPARGPRAKIACSAELIHYRHIVEQFTRIGANNRSPHDPRASPGSRSYWACSARPIRTTFGPALGETI
ncbi:hypothetical protein A2U01_0008488 [Trifolium medium]|uniref:Uncharacterized protein n=1 Tax=Trifolium medium TaxID=97028 RepID=A0A392MMV4_9FABA|nr:hypothetical protein [Trifolium medium]